MSTVHFVFPIGGEATRVNGSHKWLLPDPISKYPNILIRHLELIRKVLNRSNFNTEYKFHFLTGKNKKHTDIKTILTSVISTWDQNLTQISLIHETPHYFRPESDTLADSLDYFLITNPLKESDKMVFLMPDTVFEYPSDDLYEESLVFLSSHESLDIGFLVFSPRNEFQIKKSGNIFTGKNKIKKGFLLVDKPTTMPDNEKWDLIGIWGAFSLSSHASKILSSLFRGDINIFFSSILSSNDGTLDFNIHHSKKSEYWDLGTFEEIAEFYGKNRSI